VGELNGIVLNCLNNNDNWEILFRKIFLRIISLLRGSILGWLIFPTPYIVSLIIYLKFISFIFCLLGIYLGYLIFLGSQYFLNNFIIFTLLFFLFINILFIIISTISTVKFPLIRGNYLKVIDSGWSEILGRKGLNKLIIILLLIYYLIYSNIIKIYIIGILIRIIIFILIF